MSLRLVPALLFAAALAGGCTPYAAYAPEVSRFAAGAAALPQAYRSQVEQLPADRQAAERIGRIATRPRMIASTGCAAPGFGPCELTYEPAAAPAAIPIAPASPAMFEALGAYVAALQHITDAADRKAFDAATGKLAASASAMAAAVGAPLGAPALVAPVVGGIVRLAGEIAGDVMDAERYYALRREVPRAAEAVDRIGLAAAANLGSVVSLRRTQLSGDLLAITEALRRPGGDYAALDDRARVLRDAIVALDSVDAKALGVELRAAHRALAEALREDSRQLDAVEAAGKRLFDAGKAIQSALKTTKAS